MEKSQTVLKIIIKKKKHEIKVLIATRGGSWGK